MLERYRDEIAAIRRDNRKLSLSEMIDLIGGLKREEEPHNPYRILARLPLDLYVTASPSDLLAEALRASNPPKDPISVVHRWNVDMTSTSVFDDDPDFRPSVERPLVYHIFGRLDDDASMVLAEDSYFQFLLGFHRKETEIPPFVKGATGKRSLLFLGFQMDDWSFRVLFRSLLNQETREARARFPHVAVQVDPDDEQYVNPARARRYLESHLKTENIDIFWGSTEEFFVELEKRRAAWERHQGLGETP
jgi:hypothetical protein